MGRKNEIKKDIWKILREVYCIHEQREITDKQNEFLDRVISYLDENISLRRKVVKDKPEGTVEDEIPFEPLLRPEPVKPPPLPEKVEPEPKNKKKKEKAVSQPKIDINALPEHLRKYVK